MIYHVHTDKETRTYPDEAAFQAAIRSGEISEGMLYWHKGMPDWESIPEISDKAIEQSERYQSSDIYLDMRQNIFSLSEEQIELVNNEGLAIIMETGLEDACYTLVATADGSASLYFSTGGGVIGAGQHPEGARVAKEFLDFSRDFDDQLHVTKEYPLPSPGMTRFYSVKHGSVLTGAYKEDDLGNGRLPLSPLFHKGHELITVIRLIEESNQSV